MIYMGDFKIYTSNDELEGFYRKVSAMIYIHWIWAR